MLKKIMAVTSFTKSFIEDGKFIVEETKKFKYDIEMLSGKGIVTHVGGNGRFKFKINEQEYTTLLVKNMCTDVENDTLVDRVNEKYFDYSMVILDRDVESEWSDLYNINEDKNYWRQI